MDGDQKAWRSLIEDLNVVKCQVMCAEETPDTIQLHRYDFLYLLGRVTSVREHPQAGTDTLLIICVLHALTDEG